MRHAKAEPWAASDHARRLTARGTADAEAAGRWLADFGFTPEVALVSGAARTRDTWSAAAEAAGWDLPGTFDEGLYSADPDTVLDLIRALDEHASTAMLIGHNPTMAALAQLLDDGTGERPATELLLRGFPTAALAVFELPDSWQDVAYGECLLRAAHVGRG